MTKLKKYFYNRYVVIGVIIVAIVLFFILRSGNSSAKLEYATAQIGNIVEKVSVTGKVSPVDKADLAFEKSGIVTVIAHKIGARVKRDELIASLDTASDYAGLMNARAQLAESKRGLRPEEYANDQSAVLTASTSLANAQMNAVTAARDGYVKAQSAVVNYADTFFNNPQSANPTINIRVQSTVAETNINQERVVISESLQNWKNLIDKSSDSSNAPDMLNQVENYLNSVKNFMADLSVIVNDLNPGNSGLTQSAIDAHVTAMNTGLSTLTQAITVVNTADTALKSSQAAFAQANSQFELQKAGSSVELIAALQARVAQAQAELDKNKIISPIDGILVRSDPNLGEFVTAGQTAFAVQSDGAFKIEANVPEADIAKIALDNSADVTLDAYGSLTYFSATVTAIDPAETILEGVPTYKVTLMFVKPDPRIRSGMTANTDILTREHDNVLSIPARAVITANDEKTVRVLRSDGKNYDTITVTTGLKGSDGMIEIISGISAGQKVVTYVK